MEEELNPEPKEVIIGEMIDLSESKSPRGSQPFTTSPRGLTKNSSPKHNDQISQIVSTITFTRGEIPWIGRVFMFLQTLSNWGTVIMGAVWLGTAYQTKMGAFPDRDVNTCTNFKIGTFQTNDHAYYLSQLILSTLFCYYFGVRAIMLEKSSLLILFSILQIIISAQLIQYSYFIMASPDFTPAQIEAACALSIVFIILNSVLIALTYFVNQQFGWRMYLRGVTHAQSVAFFRMYRVFDSFVKFDSYLTGILLLSFAFIVQDSVFVRVLLVMLGVGTLAASFIVGRAVRAERSAWVWLWLVLCLIMPPYQIFEITRMNSEIQSEVFCDKSCLVSSCEMLRNSSSSYNNSSSTSSSNSTDLRNASSMTDAPSNDNITNTTVPPSSTPTSSNVIHQPTTPGPTQPSEEDCEQCCEIYGKCFLRRRRFIRSGVILIIVCVMSLLVRAVAMFFAYRHLQSMGRGMKEMFERSAISIKNNRVLYDIKRGFQLS